jgi:hypothetical protein
MNMTPRELLEEAALFRSMQEKTPDKLSVMS